MIVMYRNGFIVSINGLNGGSIWEKLVQGYVSGSEWWPLKENESVWFVPNTIEGFIQ